MFLALWLALVPALLALLGTALLRPLHQWLVDKVKANRSVAAGLTCVAVLAVVGGAVYVATAALVDTWGQIVLSVRRAVQQLADQFGASGTSLEDLADDALDLLGRFARTAASSIVAGVGVAAQVLGMAVLALLLVFFFLRDSDRAAGTLRRHRLHRRLRPLLGALTSGAAAVLVALADRGLAIALWVLGVVLVVQVLEGNIFQPMVQSRTACTRQ